MKFNHLSGILLVLLLITGANAYLQKVEADAQRQMAQDYEARALVIKAEADQNAMEAKRQAEIAQMATIQAQAALTECMAEKRK